MDQVDEAPDASGADTAPRRLLVEATASCEVADLHSADRRVAGLHAVDLEYDSGRTKYD